MPDRLRLELITTAGTRRAIMIGELDAASAVSVHEVLDPLAGEHLSLDLAEISFMDSSGLRCLLELRTAAAAAGGQVTIDAASTQVRRVVELSGLDELLLRH